MKNCKIIIADKNDSEEILKLYKAQIGGAADWNEHYPSEETIEFDLKRNALFVMKNESNEIIAVISIDDDQEVADLNCWNKELEPSAELARLCVREDMRNKGIARLMMEYTFRELKRQGKKGVHILVRPEHKVALQSYSHLDYIKVGECELFDKRFICLERPLN